MGQPVKIRPYPKFFKYLPISDTGFTTLVFKTIYLNESIYEDIKKPNPTPLSVAVLKHQEVHAKDASLIKVLRFLLFKDFRIKEEQEAFGAMFKHLKQHNQTFDLNRVARNFSGLRYLWMTSYEKGLELITKVWKET